MRHRHVTVTVEGATIEAIEARLDPGETVADWMADAIRRRLDERDDGPAYEFVDDCAI